VLGDTVKYPFADSTVHTLVREEDTDRRSDSNILDRCHSTYIFSLPLPVFGFLQHDFQLAKGVH